jgi:2,3-bisphosphoglycerate-dependent phosphoglycerate mutase
MGTRLLLVRHGESVHTRERIVGGPNGCRGLTPTGHEQAHRRAIRLAAELGSDQPPAIYSSTLRRAVETAIPIARAFGVRSTQDCGLCTWHVPPHADGRNVEEFRTEYGLDGGGIYRPFEQGNETWAELVLRVSRALLDILARHRGGTILVVGHTETVGASFHALGHMPLYRPFELLVAPGSTTEWITDDDPAGHPPARWTLVRFSAD